jgi:3D (Asp-Asp-Asp) domain-containing protein
MNRLQDPLVLAVILLFCFTLFINGIWHIDKATLNEFDGIETIDPYEPEPDAFKGLTEQEIKDLEAEKEASKAMDREVLKMEATAYTLHECDGDGYTATMTVPKEGRTIAVDPSIIPYGSKLTINGVSGYVAEDCGGAIKGNRLDIYMVNRHDALRFGRQEVKVVIE